MVAKKLTVKLWGKGVVPKEETIKGSIATKYYIRKEGQFMYGKLDFLHAAFGIVPKLLDGYESTLDSPAFDFLENIDPHFFLESVLQKNFYLYQGMIANGSRKAKRIHSDTFLKMPIKIPKVAEQQKIGIFFKHLDELITLHQCRSNRFLNT
ncbi:restriction endonuclease subunit S [Ligilactobacillus apodemi]|uniref:restriction endonuclease subunit S n=1 Tax=Ligilactobacillus apodemi TaxID=307126 RepID=UPI00214C5855|nr:restriction endonuclease subunit S [Ligilactobacillus apodemi]MCR1900516.1 restriction endonuclease subunit S [Ligilactobacillus apodemi]